MNQLMNRRPVPQTVRRRDVQSDGGEGEVEVVTAAEIQPVAHAHGS
jgi:hypothetical protein